MNLSLVSAHTLKVDAYPVELFLDNYLKSSGNLRLGFMKDGVSV